MLSYEKYKEYGGILDEAAFNIYGYEAWRKINKETFGRIKTVTEPIGRCIARVTDLYSKADVSKEKISSWSNDGVSASVQNVSQSDCYAQIDVVICNYLSEETDETGTPLLYLGGVRHD